MAKSFASVLLSVIRSILGALWKLLKTPGAIFISLKRQWDRLPVPFRKTVIISGITIISGFVAYAWTLLKFTDRFARPWSGMEQYFPGNEKIPQWLTDRFIVAIFAAPACVLPVGLFVWFLIINPQSPYFIRRKKALAVVIGILFAAAVLPWILPPVEPSISKEKLSSLTEEEQSLYKMARKGEANPETYLGLSLLTSNNGQYRDEGIKFLLAAANNHSYGKAEYSLGMLFEQGKYLTRDYHAAYYCFERAILHGDGDAMKARENNPAYQVSQALNKQSQLLVNSSWSTNVQETDEYKILQHQLDVAEERLKTNAPPDSATDGDGYNNSESGRKARENEAAIKKDEEDRRKSGNPAMFSNF